MTQTEVTRKANASAGPEIGFQNAMRRFVISGPGTICCLAEISATAFVTQVREGIAKAPEKKRAALTKDLLEDERLNYNDRESRYFALVELAKVGIHITFSMLRGRD